MIKIIIVFLLVLNLTGCNVTKKELEIYNNSNKEIVSSDSATFLTANYYISKGDAYTASKILNKRIESFKLLQLKFFTNLVSGNFEVANNISVILAPKFKKNNIYHLPRYIIDIKKNKINQSFGFFEKNKLSIGLNNLIPLIKLWVLKEENKIDLKFNNDHEKWSIHKLLILENFNKPANLKKIADKIYKSENLNSNDILLLAGFYFRLKDFDKFNKIVRTKLSDQFDKEYIVKNFSVNNNIFYKTPTLHTILASKIYNNSIFNNKQNDNSYSFQKILLEMSLYLCPNLDIAKYSLAEIYNLEKTNEIALKKLESISLSSFFFLPSSLKKLSVIKSLDNEHDYKNLLFKFKKRWPTNKFLLYRLATYYKSRKKYYQSAKIYKNIINIYGESDRDLFLYASNLDKIGKWNDAKILFLNLLKKNPMDTHTLNYVSYKLALKNQDLDFALSLIKKALNLDPDNGYFLDTIGWVEFKRKNYKKATFYLEKSTSILPKSSEVLDHLGDSYLMLGRKNEAIFEWKKAIKYEKNKNIIKIIKKKLSKYE